MITDKIAEIYPPEPDLETLLELPPDEVPAVLTDKLQKRRLTPEEALTKLGSWYHRIDAESRALEAKYRPLIDDMEADIKYLDNTKAFIKSCIGYLLPPDKESQFVNERVYIHYTETKETVITEPEAVPIEFCKVVDPIPEKRAIKAALEAGQEVPGAALQLNYHLQVKPGGARALKNSQNRLKRLEKAAAPEELTA